MRRRHQVTQADIAKALDLSPALVALVVGRSNSPLRYCVKESTAKKIQAKAEEMGYRPNRAAQATRSGRSNLIIHLSRGGYLDIASQVSYHIGRLVHESGFDLQTVDAYWWAGDGKEVIEQILSFQPEGMIVSGAVGIESNFSEIHRAGIPMSTLGLKLQGLPLVGYDARGAVRGMTRHCLQGGRTPVFVVRAPGRRFWQVMEREWGYKDALKEAGYREEIPEIHILKQKWKQQSPAVISDPHMGNLVHPFEDGMRVGEWFLRGKRLPDALICSNDHYAIGIMTVLQRAGVRIPEDVAVTGFDNMDYSTQGKVALTSVEQPVEALCRTSFHLLMEKMGRKKSKEKTLIHPCRIHWRDSTRFSSQPHQGEESERRQPRQSLTPSYVGL